MQFLRGLAPSVELARIQRLNPSPARGWANLAAGLKAVRFTNRRGCEPIRLLKALNDTVYYAAGIVATRAVGFLLVPVNTHLLPTADYGRLEILLACADIGSLMFSLGLLTALSRLAGTLKSWDERKRMCAELLGMSLIFAVLLGAAVQLFCGGLAGVLPGNIRPVELRLLMVSLSVHGLIGLCLSWLRLRGRARDFMLVSVGRVALQAIISTTALALWFGVAGMLAGTAIAALAEAAVVLRMVIKDCGIRFTAARLRLLALYCGPMLLSALAAIVLGSFDRWILAGVVTDSELGVYGLAVKMGGLVAALVQPFQMWWLPRRFMVLHEEDGRRRSVEVVNLGLMMTMIAGVTIALAGPEAIALMTPPDYHRAMTLVPWLAAVYVIQECGTLMNIGCFDSDDGFLALGINLTAAAVTLLAYVLLIPSLHVAGAIVATIGGQLLRTVLYHVFSQRQVRLDYPISKLALFMGTLCLATGLIFLLIGSPLLLAIAAVPAVAGLVGLGAAIGLVPTSWLARLRATQLA